MKFKLLLFLLLAFPAFGQHTFGPTDTGLDAAKPSSCIAPYNYYATDTGVLYSCNGGLLVQSQGSLGPSGSISIQRANSSTGTVLNKLAKLVVSGSTTQAQVSTTSDTNGVAGCVTAGAGSSGNATIATLGIANCLYDNVATVAGDFVTPSGAVGGVLADAGSSFPSNNTEVMGRVLDTHAPCGAPPCGPYPTLFLTPDTAGASGGGGAPTSFNVASATYNGKPDGSTDNATAITAAQAAYNAVTQGMPVLYFPCVPGVGCNYKFSGSGISPLNPLIPGTIKCDAGVTLTYTGTAHMMDIAPTTLNIAGSWQDPAYTIEGCNLVFSSTQTQGIYLNSGAVHFVMNHVHQDCGLTCGSGNSAVGSWKVYANGNGANWWQEYHDVNFTDLDGVCRNGIYTGLGSNQFELLDHVDIGSFQWTGSTYQSCNSGLASNNRVNVYLAGIGSRISNSRLQFMATLVQFDKSCAHCSIEASYLGDNPGDSNPGVPALMFGTAGDAGGTQIGPVRLHGNTYHNIPSARLIGVNNANDSIISPDFDFDAGGPSDTPGELAYYNKSEATLFLYNTNACTPVYDYSTTPTCYALEIGNSGGKFTALNAPSTGTDYFCVANTNCASWNGTTFDLTGGATLNNIKSKLSQRVAGAFSTLPTCAAGTEGQTAAVNDSTTITWGATITGSGANHVLAYCDGTNWTVAAK